MNAQLPIVADYTHIRTPRAFDAIVGQLTCKGFHETEIEADLLGETVLWTAFFETETDPYGGIASDGVCACVNYTLAGAWAEDGDGHLYAGSRDEVAALVGDAEVRRWERLAEDRV